MSARTTDQAVLPEDVNPADMPDAIVSYTTLFCTFIGQTTATVPTEAWAAFLTPGENGAPGAMQTWRRFETQILRLGAKLGAIPGHDVLIGAGYGFVGYTTSNP